MNDDEIRTLAESLSRRGGLARLARLLGFDEPPPTPQRPRGLRVPVRAMRTIARGTAHLHIFELRTPLDAGALRELSRYTRHLNPSIHHIVISSDPGRRRIVIACDALRDGIRHVALEPLHVRPSDVETLRELAAVPGESGTAAALRVYRALDRRRLTDRFFRDVRGVRDSVARAWRGLPDTAAADRDALALLMLSRLMFLYFLQRRGLLAGDPDYLPGLFARWRRCRNRRRSFYRVVLCTLFFGALNCRPDRRSARARSLGCLPYLNGGLFEKHRLEARRADIDLDDDVVAGVFDALLEKYRFTSADVRGHPGDDAVGAGIDPEMLGRIFEGLMPGDQRSRTGSFYTPADTVDALTVETLASHLANAAGVPPATVRRILRREPSEASDRDLRAVAAAAEHITVLDPACGSGAFLLGALARIQLCREAGMRGPRDHERAALRSDIVGRSLHGVDLLEDAALICSLRMWLSLIPQCDSIDDVPPLPNLDRRIRQGDALIDPLDLGGAYNGRAMSTLTPPELRPLLRELEPAASQYLSSGPESRPALRRALASLESSLATAWLDALSRQLEHELRETRARAGDVDLFGAAPASAAAARARLPAIAARHAEMTAFRSDVAGSGSLPFFSFRVHFAGIDGFDVVLSNPPWVRAHNWPPTVRQLLRRRYRVCAEAGWPHASNITATPAGAGAQVDLAFLFLERSLRLLRPGGTLGTVLPAKLIRSLAPGGARALLLADSRIVSITDHSLDQRAVFDADAFTTVLVAQRHDVESASDVTAPPRGVACSPDVHVRMSRAGADLEFGVTAADLPLLHGDLRSPWLLAPPDCAAAFRRMQSVGESLRMTDHAVRRGAMTGANDVMIVQDVQPKIGDLARIRTEGYYRAGAVRRRFTGYVEASALRPVLRGTDVQRWGVTPERFVLWSPLNAAPGHPVRITTKGDRPPRVEQARLLGAFLSRHSAALKQPAHRLGTLQRLSAGMYGHKVVWSDLAADLRAAAVPAVTRAATGMDVPIIPLNTVYFVPVACERDALLLAGYLNSLPLRTFARAIAERAKDAHFRFFAWTIAMLPLPPCWRTDPAADVVLAISQRAHAAGFLDPRASADLDCLVARMYGLDADQLMAVTTFDAWLSGKDGCA